MKRLFDRLATEREEFCAQLFAKLREPPRAAGSLTAALHRSWLDLRDKVGGMSQAELLRECARGEAAAIKKYEHALTKPVPREIESTLTTHLLRLTETHTHLSALATSFD